MENKEKIWTDTKLDEAISDLPLRIRKDIKSLPFPKIEEVVSTYLFGKVGSGKTIYSVFLMLTELKNHFMTGKRTEALFISVPELLFEFKQSYDRKSEITENTLVDKYSKIPLLVLDDFGVERTTDWSFQLLYIIINRRYDNMKKTIFTSNLSLLQLAEKLQDDRIPSRIQQMCKIIETSDKNYRSR